MQSIVSMVRHYLEHEVRQRQLPVLHTISVTQAGIYLKKEHGFNFEQSWGNYSHPCAKTESQ